MLRVYLTYPKWNLWGVSVIFGWLMAQGWLEGISLHKSYASQQGLLAQAANKSHGQAGLIWMVKKKGF